MKKIIIALMCSLFLIGSLPAAAYMGGGDSQGQGGYGGQGYKNCYYKHYCDWKYCYDCKVCKRQHYDKYSN